MTLDTIGAPQRPFERLQNRGVGLPSLPVALAILGITASEAAVFSGYLEYTLWGYLATLLFCALSPLLFTKDASVFQTLTLIPVFRIVNLGTPLLFDLTLYWLAFIYLPFLPAAYLVATSRPETELSYRWVRALLLLPIAVPVSAALGVVEYSLIDPFALIPAWTNEGLLVIGVVMFGLVAVVEELLFRGALQPVFQHRIGRWSGLALTSFLFGIMHSGYGVVFELLFAMAIGLLLGLVYEYVKSIVLVIIMHGTIDLFLFAVVPHHQWLVPYLYQHVPF